MLLPAGSVMGASAGDVADAAMKGDREAVRSLLQRKGNVNAPQVDGTTALHWAVRADDLDRRPADPRRGECIRGEPRRCHSAVARLGERECGDDRETSQSGSRCRCSAAKYRDTALMMAARTGKTDAIKVLLDNNAEVNAKET